MSVLLQPPPSPPPTSPPPPGQGRPPAARPRPGTGRAHGSGWGPNFPRRRPLPPLHHPRLAPSLAPRNNPPARLLPPHRARRGGPGTRRPPRPDPGRRGPRRPGGDAGRSRGRPGRGRRGLVRVRVGAGRPCSSAEGASSASPVAGSSVPLFLGVCSYENKKKERRVRACFPSRYTVERNDVRPAHHRHPCPHEEARQQQCPTCHRPRHRRSGRGPAVRGPGGRRGRTGRCAGCRGAAQFCG